MAKPIRPDPTLELLSELRTDMKAVHTKLASIDTTLVQQKTILDEHVRRTGLAEEAIKATALIADAAVKAALLVKEQAREELQTTTEPLKAHLSAWAGAGKALTIFGVVMTIAASIAGIIYKFVM